MSELAAVSRALAEALGEPIGAIAPIAGGDINDAFRASTATGLDIFIKTSAKALPGARSAEADGLAWLAEPAALRVPKVIAVVDSPAAADSTGPIAMNLLALEWIDSGTLSGAGEEQLGRGLATIHNAGAPAFGAVPRADGYCREPIRFNDLELPNDPHQTWAEFYGHGRILPLTRTAISTGHLDHSALPIMERLCERLPELAGPIEPPARIHGDLWSGNVMADTDGKPVLIDPAAHGGHRELDLALLRLFGGPSERCYSAYNEVAPLAYDHQERVVLWQIAMILLHAVLLGGRYGNQALSMARRYT